ncbi:MAG TPA: FAD/NAD(P)-binding oxidoreductase [Symbiobacteriaceae bacterium]|nr:FAD/NAD(P)-binding oxidoreductase [Symbiobacteriaceae bacterium]
MAKELLVVGAGSGGLILSNTVARSLAAEIRRGEVTVTLLGDRDEYLYQPGLLYVVFDLMRPTELVRKVKDLLVPGVRFVHDRATKIDPEKRTVQTRAGKTLSYDYLVIATGSELNLEETPGLKEGAHWFYDLPGAIKLREKLSHFQGGKVVVALGLPHKCPVAPLEFVFMLDEWARERSIRSKMEITYAYPLNRAHNIQTCADWAQAEFDSRGIQLETFFNIESVDPVKQEVTSLECTTLPYDLLVAIPAHKGDAVHRESGLAGEGNWVPTHRHTLQMGNYENVFVIGDATNLPTSKAGSVAHFEAEVLSGNLVNLLTGGGAPHLYDGKTFCFIEAGMHKATYLSFNYDNPPVPGPPSEAIHWFKQAYNRIHWMNLKGIV